jgi:cation/acetate symporter
MTSVLVSRRTTVPDDLPQIWVRMHGTAADRAAEHLAELTIADLGSRSRR